MVLITNFTRDFLRDSKSCRFCGITGEKGELEQSADSTTKEGLDTNSSNLLTENTDKDNITFISIFEKYRRVQEETFDVDAIINKYLPIQVSRTDPYYPKYLCSECFLALDGTVSFFDKIIKGQQLLAKVIEQSTVSGSEPQIFPKEKLVYSRENIIIQALPKKRGRPKKDLTNVLEKQGQPEETSIPEFSVKPKRVSRPPQRYSAKEYIGVEKEDSEEFPNQGAKENSSSNPVGKPIICAAAKTLELKAKEEKSSGHSSDLPADTSPSNESNEHTINNEKNEGTQTSSLLGNCNSKDKEANQDKICPNSENTSRGDCLLLKDDGPDGDSVEGDDSDTSVRTIDLIKNKDNWNFLKKGTKGRMKSKSQKVNRKTKTKVRRFECSECDKTFLHKSSLRYHCSMHHCDPAKRKKYNCEICGKIFHDKTLLSNHLHSHSNEQTFKCDSCPAKFKNRSSLYSHKNSIHCGEAKPFSCDICGNRFTLKASLKAHTRIHTNEKPYVCDYCKKSFTQRCNMVEHVRIHTGARPYLCSWADCGKRYITSSQLRAHERIHTNTKLYYCDICGKGMSHSVAFKYHLKRHNNERNLECDVCGKRFIDPWSLKTHKRVHTGEKPHKCDFCRRSFSNQSNFMKHRKIHILNNDEVVSVTTNDASRDSSAEVAVPVTSLREDEEISIPIQIKFDSCSGASFLPHSTSSGQHVSDSNTGLPIHDGASTLQGLEIDPSSLVIHQLAPGENLTVGDDEQKFIYIYPENGPIFTVTLADNQAIELHGSSEAFQMLGNLDQLTFAVVDNNEFGAEYLSVEVDPTSSTASGTTAAPISPPLPSGSSS